MNFKNNLNNILKYTESNNNVKVLYPKRNKKEFNDLSRLKNSVFLAGPCPRKDYKANDWRENTYAIFNNLCFDGTIINPTNEYFDTTNADELKIQTEWEYEALHKASAIIFYLNRTDDNPGFTTNVEFGYYCNMPNVFVCIPDGCTKNANRYIKLMCEKKNIPVFSTMEDTVAAVVNTLNRPGKTWYLSDTHFGQERTMVFSKRPFNTVKEMDLTIISNWNKHIMKNDIVYHLGDFGEDPSILKTLNYKELHFIKGNYEREKLPEVANQIAGYENVHIYDNDECTVTSNNFKYILRHEPVIGSEIPEDTLCIYGHIHGRQLIKENGIDVGIDGHNFCPTSQEDVDFFANAIKQNFYDENVMSSICK